MSVIPVLRELRQEDIFKATLSYVERPCFKTQELTN
jgi:hypothetical protein